MRPPLRGLDVHSSTDLARSRIKHYYPGWVSPDHKVTRAVQVRGSFDQHRSVICTTHRRDGFKSSLVGVSRYNCGGEYAPVPGALFESLLSGKLPHEVKRPSMLYEMGEFFEIKEFSVEQNAVA